VRICAWRHFRAAEAHDLPMPGFVPILRAGNIGDGLDLENDLLWVPSSRVRPRTVSSTWRYRCLPFFWQSASCW